LRDWRQISQITGLFTFKRQNEVEENTLKTKQGETSEGLEE
jgi:hypothetical protein